jgi:hypothetical protein
MRTQLKSSLIIIFSTAVFLSCQQSTPRLTAEDEAAIRAANETYVKLVRAADWKTLSQLITDDTIWMPPNVPALEGKQYWIGWQPFLRSRSFGLLQLRLNDRAILPLFEALTRSVREKQQWWANISSYGAGRPMAPGP